MAKIDGTSGADILNGTADADEIDGGEGNDWIDGGSGADKLLGGAGDDIISDQHGGGSVYGGDGADSIHLMYHYQIESTLLVDGGNDNDTIRVGAPYPGAVTIIGGGGSDRIDLSFAADAVTITLGTQRDILTFGNSLRGEQGETNFLMSSVTVTDFVTGNSGDVFDLGFFLGTSLLAWNQTANPFGAGYVRLLQSGTSTLVQVDFDAAGSAFAFQTLVTLGSTSKSAFTTANFAGYNPNGATAAGSTVNGTAADDQIAGTMGVDTISGLGGGDDVKGSGGSDTIKGGDGNDVLHGEVGHDLLLGEGGNDYLIGGVGADQLRGGDGSDSIFGDRGANVLDGGAGGDFLYGDIDNDTLIGGDGDDVLHDPGGSNSLDGGEGNDTLEIYSIYGASPQSVLGGAGNDRVVIYTYNSPSPAAFVVDAGSGTDRIEINGDCGPVRLTLGSGMDMIALTGSYRGLDNGGFTVRDFQVGPSGEALEWSAFLSASLIGWNGSNPFTAGYLKLVQSGSSTLLQIDVDGDDFSYGFVTLGTFENAIASDFTFENLGYHFLPVKNGTSASNRVVGTSAAERINGLEGNDVLLGLGGADLLVGGVGNDRLEGGVGKDRHFGGAGNDIYVVDDSGDRVFELAGEGIDLVRSVASFTLPGEVENLTLEGSAAVNGTGNAGANVITGNAAANTLKGAGGNDTLIGGAATDRLEGGTGNDLFVADSAADVVVELAGQGTDTVQTAIGYALGANVENLILTGGGNVSGTGNGLANSLSGNGAANRLDGGTGADTMAGGLGHDVYVVDNAGDVVTESGSSGNDTVETSVDFSLPTHFEKLVITGTAGRTVRGNSGDNNITGNSGANTINGGSGNDAIDAGAGNDLVYGHTGNDSLKGGTGLDRFFFNSALGSTNVDKILDFYAPNDTINLARSIFTKAGAAGTLSASAFRQGTAAGDASDRIVYDQASGKIFYDGDGNGAAAAVLFATVTAGTALTNADFVVYG
jgi:Ca2+-binding RTX toxin-like protein